MALTPGFQFLIALQVKKNGDRTGLGTTLVAFKFLV